MTFNPSDPYPHNGLGNILLDRREFGEAVAEYRTALNLNPNFQYAHNTLGRALEAEGKVTEAIAEYQTAIKLDPKNAEAHYNLGLLFRNRATEQTSPNERNAALTEACREFAAGAVLAPKDPAYPARMHSIDLTLTNGQHCPPR
jgi:tetratricopeptide (TPR) repeat protein